MKRKNIFFIFPILNRIIFQWFLIAGVVVIFFSADACKKSNNNSPQLPPNTQEGKNTFGCNLNGDVWLPNASCGYFSNPCAGMSVSVFRPFAADTFPLGITITVQKKISNVTTYIQMVTKNILTNSAAYVYSPGNIYDSLRINYTNQNGIQYHTLDGKPGIVNITRLDVKNEIISGNFNFTLFIQGGDSLVFSDGRFDLKFNVCKCY